MGALLLFLKLAQSRFGAGKFEDRLESSGFAPLFLGSGRTLILARLLFPLLSLFCLGLSAHVLFDVGKSFSRALGSSRYIRLGRRLGTCGCAALAGECPLQHVSGIAQRLETAFLTPH
ncbi:hypothetical protein K3179_00385 [Qipengyuania sp. GH38]|uniref:hypothetical protein n=1 Tax=Qipengyuania intermedia TaxID=2867244 RepID=UPI001C869D45|nr:hypothetical protein [Qipengyuania intermedia]MBX7512994.1 hypothetical protein [Qipengyuania intermedia]